MTTGKIYHVDFKQSKKIKFFPYAGGKFEVQAEGVYYKKKDKDGNELPPLWLCSHLYVLSKTRDTNSADWGRLLEWEDDDGEIHHWAMPLALLQGDSNDVRRELASAGLSISPNKVARELLSTYIQAFPVEERAICIKNLGWQQENFVTEKKVFGEAKQRIVFQNDTHLHSALSVSGTVLDWKRHVSQLAINNSRLVFSISCAFAPILLNLIGEDSGGFHLRGTSSSGKTTALNVAASVWGNPKNYIRLWRSTANGLEGLASLHNDGLLILDEIGQMDPKQVGESAYLLANGQGKNRANKLGASRQSASWSLLFLSAGEENLASLMNKAGLQASAGQEIRLADIEADAEEGMGLFEDLHDFASPSEFSIRLKNASKDYYGAVGLAWISMVVKHQRRLQSYIPKRIEEFLRLFSSDAQSGQVKRVARRFALVYIAGELATLFGLTGWEKGEALKRVAGCYLSWINNFGSLGNREERQILSQVKAFFEAHGSSRFENIREPNRAGIPNRAGFYRTDDRGYREYLVLSSVYRKEVCKGYDPKMVNKVLKKMDWLIPDHAGNASQKLRIRGVGIPRCYVFTQNMWSDDLDESS